jgi:hypothetical protein
LKVGYWTGASFITEHFMRLTTNSPDSTTRKLCRSWNLWSNSLGDCVFKNWPNIRRKFGNQPHQKECQTIKTHLSWVSYKTVRSFLNRGRGNDTGLPEIKGRWKAIQSVVSPGLHARFSTHGTLYDETKLSLSIPPACTRRLCAVHFAQFSPGTVRNRIRT